MKSTLSKFIVLVFMTTCIFGINYGCNDNPSDSGDNVSNTNFEAVESISFEINVMNHSRLRLEAINSNINIAGMSNSDSVIISCEKRVGSESTEDAEAHLQQLDVVVQDLSNEIFVKTVQPQETYGRNYMVSYTITLPKNLEILIHNINGTVTLDSIDNIVSVNNVNGQIVLEEIFSSAHVALVNGQIESKVTLPLDGTIDMSIVNGIINLEIPQSTSAELSASLVNGTIVVNNLDLQNIVSSLTSFQEILGDGRGIISLSTVNGNIKVIGF
ncbi:hypothetical protein AMJ80_04280 [bacterium SM23_31]|nr:MAG: hypothetical protein AMJ80_04280 [bacterium SM23_31]